MLRITIRIENKLKEQLMQFAKNKNESISLLLRKLIAEGLAVAEYKKQNEGKPEVAVSADRQKLEAEYKINLDFMALEVSALLRLIVKKSGKFTDKESHELLTTAKTQAETYLRRYESLHEKSK